MSTGAARPATSGGRAENPYDHISDRGGAAPVMQHSYDRPAGLDNPRAPRRGGGMPNFEKYAWLFMRFSGIVLVFLALGHLFIMLMWDDGVYRIDFNYVAQRWSSPFWQIWDLLLLWLPRKGITPRIARSGEKANAGMGVLQIIADDIFSRHRRAHESILALGHDRVPARLPRVVDADRHDPSARGVAVGAHVEHRAVIAHELVLGVEPGAAALLVEAVDEGLQPLQRITAMIVVAGGDDDAEVRFDVAVRTNGGRHVSAHTARATASRDVPIGSRKSIEQGGVQQQGAI